MVVYSSVVALRKARVPTVNIKRGTDCCLMFHDLLHFKCVPFAPKLTNFILVCLWLLVCLSNRLKIMVRMLYTAHWLSITTSFVVVVVLVGYFLFMQFPSPIYCTPSSYLIIFCLSENQYVVCLPSSFDNKYIGFTVA